jgi:XTP/dITP diphosphohydrolase
LGGRPGVYSARFSGEGATDASNRELLLELLKETPKESRTARFICAIAIASPKGDVRVVHGSCEGRVNFAPRGSNGFGYDPLFEVPEYDWKTFAELEESQKNAISHRGRALQAAKDILKDLPAS